MEKAGISTWCSTRGAFDLDERDELLGMPPHVMVYFVMALALFAGEDYEEVATRLTETLASWGCWDDSWSVPTSGGITQARQRLGSEPLELLLAR